MLLALSLGCGLDAPEIIRLRTRDVEIAPGDSAVGVSVGGPRYRPVLCRQTWEAVLAEAVRWVSVPGRVRYLILPDSRARTPDTISGFLACTTPAPGGEPLNMDRASDACLVRAVEAQMPLTVLMAATGQTTLRFIDRIMPHVRTPPPEHAAAIMRFLR